MWCRYPDDLQWAESTADIESAWSAGKIASMIGVESGHAIGSSLPILRTLYAMGARYLKKSFRQILRFLTSFRFKPIKHWDFFDTPYFICVKKFPIAVQCD